MRVVERFGAYGVACSDTKVLCQKNIGFEVGLLGVIPARGGSKGIFRKNIKYFCEKPLIAWTIEAALQSNCIDRLIVSTDDEEIASIAVGLGAEVPFLRPESLATDATPGIIPALHALEKLPDYEWLMLLQPTSPFRSHQDIDLIWEFCFAQQAASVVSICEVQKHPYWMYQMDDDQRLTSFISDAPVVTRRQDFSPVYAVNGALYLAKSEWLSSRKSFITDETLGYVMPPERSVDLDNELDWHWGEFLMGVFNQKTDLS